MSLLNYLRFSPRSRRAYGVYLTDPAAAQGPPGPAGPTGPTGPAGANGTNGTNGTNGLSGGIPNYSTTEQEAPGFTWLAGATVYCKTIPVPAGPNNNQVTIAHGITGLDVILPGITGGYLKLADESDIRLLPHASIGTTANGIVMSFDATNIYLTTGAAGNYSSHFGHVTIFYTKS